MWPVPGVEVSEGGPGEDRSKAEQEGGQGQAGPGTQGRHNDQTSWSIQAFTTENKVRLKPNENHSDSLQSSENPYPAENWHPEPVHQQTLSLQHPHLSLRHQSPNKISLRLK